MKIISRLRLLRLGRKIKEFEKVDKKYWDLIRMNPKERPSNFKRLNKKHLKLIEQKNELVKKIAKELKKKLKHTKLYTQIDNPYYFFDSMAVKLAKGEKITSWPYEILMNNKELWKRDRGNVPMWYKGKYLDLGAWAKKRNKL